MCAASGMTELKTEVLVSQENLMVLISTTVDGVSHQEDVEPRLLLVHHLRRSLGPQER
jgi:hypothetical protein